MGFDDIAAKQSAEGDSQNFEGLKDSMYKLEPDSTTTLRFDKASARELWEIWLKPSNNVPADKTDPRYCFNLKNETGYIPLAEMIGNPGKWKVNTKRKATHTKFTGGVYQFEYSDAKNEKGFYDRVWKHLHNKDFKKFFSEFGYYGEDYGLKENPEATPSLRFHIAAFIPANQWSIDNESLNWLVLSNTMMQQLIDLSNGGYDLETTWFQITRTGSTKNDTKYKVIPVPPAHAEQLNTAYDSTGYAVPDLDKSTQLSNGYYCWKYLSDYIKKMDQINGTQFAPQLENEYNEREAERASMAENQTEAQPQAATVPAAVAQAAVAPPVAAPAPAAAPPVEAAPPAADVPPVVAQAAAPPVQAAAPAAPVASPAPAQPPVMSDEEIPF